MALLLLAAVFFPVGERPARAGSLATIRVNALAGAGVAFLLAPGGTKVDAPVAFAGGFDWVLNARNTLGLSYSRSLRLAAPPSSGFQFAMAQWRGFFGAPLGHAEVREGSAPVSLVAQRAFSPYFLMEAGYFGANVTRTSASKSITSTEKSAGAGIGAGIGFELPLTGAWLFRTEAYFRWSLVQSGGGAIGGMGVSIGPSLEF